MHKAPSGFTLVELVLVIIVLSTLASIALPRFISATGQAHLSAVKGVADAFQSGVDFAQHRWRLDKQPTEVVTGITFPVKLDTGWVSVEEISGLPVGSDGLDTRTDISLTDCSEILVSLLKSNLTVTTRLLSPSLVDVKRFTYLVVREESEFDICHYYLTDALTTVPLDLEPASGVGFSYISENGKVNTFDFR